MNTRNKKLTIFIVAVLIVAVFVVVIMTIGRKVRPNMPESVKTVYIGEDSIKDYTIVSVDNGAARRLWDYIYRLTGEKLKISAFSSNDGKQIFLRKGSSDKDKIGTYMEGEKIIICGEGGKGLLSQIDYFANSYLGYAFAGSEREHFLETCKDTIYIDKKSFIDGEEAWIDEREPIICLWKTNIARGACYKPDTCLNSEILSYSDDMLYTYVKMMRYFGYTGIQVTDMCSAWAQYGSYEYVHERIRFMADAAHSMGMKFTIWVWGAEFNGYGWDDPEVDYYDNWNYGHASENPKALKCFDKYYSIYASLADCSDRIIAHFDDPGNLINDEDIAFFSKMLRDKCREKNPDINFGVSNYLNKHDFSLWNSVLEGDFTVYSGARRTPEEDWSGMRSIAGANGIEYGVWSWNLTEMEIDQLAEMNVNAHVVKSVYNLSKDQDVALKPSYWSEMDSYHLLNMFSHYCAGKLLINPDLDENELLMEAATALIGKDGAKELYEILDLIQDARSAETFSTFRWGYPDYLLTSYKYDAEDIYERALNCVEKIDALILADSKVTSIPLSVDPSEILRMIRPHIYQIRDFAKFRIDLENIEKTAAGKESKDKLYEMVKDIYSPIYEYDTIIGVWGQAEAKAQYDLLAAFCEKYGIDIPQDPVFVRQRKDRIYQEFISLQRMSNDIRYFSKKSIQWVSAYGEKEAERLADELVKEGLLKEAEDGTVYLTCWDAYCRRDE